MPYNSHLTTDHIPVANGSRTCNSCLRSNHIIFSNFHIVCDLDKIIYFSPFSYNGRTYGSPVNTTVRTYFHIVLYDYISQLWDFVIPIWCRLKTKSISTYHSIRVDNAIFSNDTAIIDFRTAVYFRVFTDFHIFTNENLWSKLNAIANRCIFRNIGKCSHINILA